MLYNIHIHPTPTPSAVPTEMLSPNTANVAPALAKTPAIPLRNLPTVNPSLAANPNIAPLVTAREGAISMTKGALNALKPLVAPLATIGLLYIGFRTMLYGVIGGQPTFLNKLAGDK